MFDKYRMDLNKLRQRVAANLPGITYGFVNNERRQRTPYVVGHRQFNHGVTRMRYM